MHTKTTTKKNKGFVPIAVSMAVITGIVLALQKIYFRD
jgi:hypothetical protein